jgi:hypothetical protein
MPWPDFGTLPQKPGRPLWQLVLVVVAVVAGSTALLSEMRSRRHDAADVLAAGRPLRQE